MSHLIQKHQQNKKGSGVIRRQYITPEQAAEFDRQRYSYTKAPSDNTRVVSPRVQVAPSNTPEKVSKRYTVVQTDKAFKTAAQIDKERKTEQQYNQAAQQTSRSNPKSWVRDWSKVPLIGIPATIAEALYAGGNYLTGNTGAARYWWQQANQDAIGHTIGLGAIPAHTNPYTAALYDGILLGDYMRYLDQQGKFRGDENLSVEDYANLAMAAIPITKIKFADPTLQRMYMNGEKTSGNAILGTIFKHKLETGKVSQQELAQVVGAAQAKWVFKNLGPLKVGHGDVMKYREIINRAVKSLEQGGRRQPNAGVRAAEEAISLQTGIVTNLVQQKYQTIPTNRDIR